MFLFSLFLIYIISYPFTPFNKFPIFWFFETLASEILPGTMPQITANAMNLWALLFGLIPRVDDSFRLISIFICLILFFPILKKLTIHFNSKNILLSLALVSLTVFMFLTRMHERYTFPALVPLLIVSILDKKYRNIFLIFSLTHLINIYNWWWVPPISFLRSILEYDLTIRFISLVNLITYFYFYHKFLTNCHESFKKS